MLPPIDPARSLLVLIDLQARLVPAIAEAEAMVDGGVADVLIANEVVGRAKLARLAQLAKRARVSVCVDDAANASGAGSVAGTLPARTALNNSFAADSSCTGTAVNAT